MIIISRKTRYNIVFVKMSLEPEQPRDEWRETSSDTCLICNYLRVDRSTSSKLISSDVKRFVLSRFLPRVNSFVLNPLVNSYPSKISVTIKQLSIVVYDKYVITRQVSNTQVILCLFNCDLQDSIRYKTAVNRGRLSLTAHQLWVKRVMATPSPFIIRGRLSNFIR